MRWVPTTVIIFYLLITGTATQQAHAGEFHPIAFIGYSDGGDTLIVTELSTINGRAVSIKSKTKGGDGITMALGAYMPVTEGFGIQGSIGTITDSVSYANGYVGFTRYPIDLLGYMHLDDHHSLALGTTYHTKGKFTLEVDDNPSASFTEDFDNALGGIFEYNYAVIKSNEGGFKIGFRYTKIQYDLSDRSQSFDGSSIGIMFYLY